MTVKELRAANGLKSNDIKGWPEVEDPRRMGTEPRLLRDAGSSAVRDADSRRPSYRESCATGQTPMPRSWTAGCRASSNRDSAGL